VRSKSGSCNLPTNTLGNLQILDRRDYVCTKFHCCPSTFPKRWFLRPKFCILNKKLRTKIFPQFVESPKFRGGDRRCHDSTAVSLLALTYFEATVYYRPISQQQNKLHYYESLCHGTNRTNSTI